MKKDRILKLFDIIEETVIILLIIVMMGAMALQVFFRYIINNPLAWTEELARYIYIWIAFIGAGYGVRHRYHIEMTALFNLFPPRLQKVDQILINIVVMISYAVIIPVSIPLLKAQHRILSVGMEVHMSYILAAVPVGCSLLVVRLLMDTIAVIKGNFKADREVYIE